MAKGTGGKLTIEGVGTFDVEKVSFGNTKRGPVVYPILSKEEFVEWRQYKKLAPIGRPRRFAQEPTKDADYEIIEPEALTDDRV